MVRKMWTVRSTRPISFKAWCTLCWRAYEPSRCRIKDVVEQALPLAAVAAYKAEVAANALEMHPAGLLVAWVVGDEHRQQAQLRGQHLEHGRGHFPRIRQEVAAPAQDAQLHTEAELVCRSSTPLDLVQVGTREAEVLPQDGRLDLSREPLGGVEALGRLQFGLRRAIDRLAHGLSLARVQAPNWERLNSHLR